MKSINGTSETQLQHMLLGIGIVKRKWWIKHDLIASKMSNPYDSCFFVDNFVISPNQSNQNRPNRYM